MSTEGHSNPKKLSVESPVQTRGFLMESEQIICISSAQESIKVNVSTGDKWTTPTTSQANKSIQKTTAQVVTEEREVDRWIALTDKGRFLIFGRKEGSLSHGEKTKIAEDELVMVNERKKSFFAQMNDKRKKQIEPEEEKRKAFTAKTIAQEVI